MLSKETRGMRFGVWATRQHIDMQIAYRAAYDVTHPIGVLLVLEDFRHTVLQSWSLEALNDLGITPTRYVDDPCFCLPPLWGDERRDLDYAPPPSGRRDLAHVAREDGEWQVDLPGWRFLQVGLKGSRGA